MISVLIIMISEPISYPICVMILFLHTKVLAFGQIKLINKDSEIHNAKNGSLLYQKPLIQDPCEKLVETHVATLE